MFFPLLKNISNYQILKDLIDKFDMYLYTLTTIEQKSITAEKVSHRLSINYDMAVLILAESHRVGLLKEKLEIRCPNFECDGVIKIVEKKDLISVLDTLDYCHHCDSSFEDLDVEDLDMLDYVFRIYELVSKPNPNKEEIRETTNKFIHSDKPSKKKSLKDDYKSSHLKITELMYCPNDAEYKELELLYNAVKKKYSKSETKAAGDSLEELTKYLFSLIEGTNATRKVKTETNQFDVTIKPSPTCKDYLCTLINIMFPYFIIECKNEEEKIDNTYAHKLKSIMEGNSARLGIIVGKNDAARTVFTISREFYLTSCKTKYLITLSLSEINDIIFSKLNLLDIIENKIMNVDANISSGKMNSELFGNVEKRA